MIEYAVSMVVPTCCGTPSVHAESCGLVSSASCEVCTQRAFRLDYVRGFLFTEQHGPRTCYVTRSLEGGTPAADGTLGTHPTLREPNKVGRANFNSKELQSTGRQVATRIASCQGVFKRPARHLWVRCTSWAGRRLTHSSWATCPTWFETRTLSATNLYVGECTAGARPSYLLTLYQSTKTRLADDLACIFPRGVSSNLHFRSQCEQN